MSEIIYEDQRKSHQPKRRFGQNFLHDQNIINKIISSFNPKPNELLLEIGPGLGALTSKILALVDHLYLIEIDKNLAEKLKNTFNSKITLFNYDILKLDFETIYDHNHNNQDQKIRIIGNLPYNISTPILFHLFNSIQRIQDMVFMLQLEVVDRMAALPQSKDYGRLSVMTQFYCDVQKLFVVPSTAFTPQPKVKSAIVYLQPKAMDLNIDQHIFANIVRDAFNQRRKTITNSLHNYISRDILSKLNLDPRLRAEDLSLEQYKNITKAVCES